MISPHMYVYLNQTLFRTLGIINNDETVCKLSAYYLHFVPSLDELKASWQYQPQTQQIVHAMLELGFSPTFIAGYMHINKATVSYHKGRDVKPFKNPYWDALEQAYAPEFHTPS